MSANHILIWNARGLNSRARRSAVRDLVEQHRASIVCLQETKVEHLSTAMNIDTTGIDYDHAYIPATGVAGGVLIAWRRDLWASSPAIVRHHSLSVCLTPLNGPGSPWWLTAVLLVSWCIWKERNARTFDHRAATSAILAQRIITEADELIGSDFSSIGLLTALAT